MKDNDDSDIWSQYLEHERTGDLKKGVKFSVYTVEKVWHWVKALIGYLKDGGTAISAQGVWFDVDKGEFHYDSDASQIIYIHESKHAIEWVRGAIRIAAEAIGEESVLETFEPILLSFETTKGNIAKLDSNNIDDQKMVVGIAASIQKHYSSTEVSRLEGLAEDSFGIRNSYIDMWTQSDNLSEDVLKLIRDLD